MMLGEQGGGGDVLVRNVRLSLLLQSSRVRCSLSPLRLRRCGTPDRSPSAAACRAAQRRTMCGAVQLLRVSVHERMSAAAEDFLLQVEKGEEAAEIPALRAKLTERLTAAAEEIVALLEETVAEYEDRVERSEREICRQRRLLDAVLKPQVKLHRADVQWSLSKEEVPTEQQEWTSGLDQEEPEPPHTKEEQEEPRTDQEADDATRLTPTPVPAKSEDDEEKPRSTQTETDGDGEDCGGPEPARTSDPDPEIDYRTTEFSVAEVEVSCDDWDETREPQSGLNLHEGRRYQKPFSCSECGKTFTRTGLLETHMRSHTGERPLSCSVCGKKYTIYRYLLRHMAMHDVERPGRQCDKTECDRRLCYSHHLKKDALSEESLFSCSVCGRKFTQRGYLMQHMARHTGNVRFRCCVCDKRFAWRHELKSHKCVGESSDLHQEDGEAEPQADGDDCSGSDSDDKTSDSSEAETKDGDDGWREPQSGFISATDTDIPLSNSSTEKKSFICSECGKTFSGEENLKTHMGTHTGEKPFSCSYCEKGFPQRDYLRSHGTVHTEEKRFLYCVCGKRFAWCYNLKDNGCVGETSQTDEDQEPPACSSKPSDSYNETLSITASLNSPTHPFTEAGAAERPFSCLQCAKTFRRKKNLQEHLRIHTGEKPYGCSVCMKYFSCSGSLRKHLRIHTGEKPFSCSVCGNRFTESGHLKVHMRTHTGEKPFICPVCGKSFTWRQSFNNHMKYHTETVIETN